MAVQVEVREQEKVGGAELLDEAALREVNRIRTSLGYDAIYELPKGDRRGPASCPIFHAFEGTGIESVGSCSLWVGPDRDLAAKVVQLLDGIPDKRDKNYAVHMRLDNPISQFVQAFDTGVYPEYEHVPGRNVQHYKPYSMIDDIAEQS